MYQILPIEPQDFDQLYQIELLAHSVPWSKGTLKNNQGLNYINLKISQQQRIIGFAICQTVLDEATLFNIAIAPDMQRKGAATILFEALFEQLRQKGILTLWLEVRESNQKAKQLYDKLGFNQVDIRKNYYPVADGSRENAIIMALYL